MPVIDTAHRVVATLTQGDPEFQAMCRALYGPDVDAERIYQDAYIAKSGPDAADVHVNRPTSSGGSRKQNWALRVGLAGAELGTVAGGVAALSEARRGFRGLRGIGHVEPVTSKLIPTKIRTKLTPRRTSGMRAVNGSFALGADAIATGALHHQKNQIGKGIGHASVDAMAKGLLVQTRRATKSMMSRGGGVVGRAPGTGAAAAGAAGPSKAGQAGQAVGRGIQAATGSPQRMAATAGVAGTMALGATAPKRREMTAGHGAQAYYSKSDKVDVEFEGRISKIEPAKRLAFGWANVCKIDGELVNDKQADITMPEDLEDAVYSYNLHGRVGGDMHMRTDGVDVYPDTHQKPGDRPVHVSDLVESVMFTAEKKKAMGLPDDFPEGWWSGFRYADTPEGEAAWQEVLAGKRPGFSIHGSGRRESVMV